MRGGRPRQRGLRRPRGVSAFMAGAALRCRQPREQEGQATLAESVRTGILTHQALEGRVAAGWATGLWVPLDCHIQTQSSEEGLTLLSLLKSQETLPAWVPRPLLCQGAEHDLGFGPTRAWSWSWGRVTWSHMEQNWDVLGRRIRDVLCEQPTVPLNPGVGGTSCSGSTCSCYKATLCRTLGGVPREGPAGASLPVETAGCNSGLSKQDPMGSGLC